MAAIIMPPPTSTIGSNGSENRATPSTLAQISCRKVIGWVTAIGATAKARVMV